MKWFLLLFVGLIWGSSFILMKKALIVYPADQVAALRLVLAFISLVPWMLGYLKGIDGRKWFYLLIAGILGNGLPAFLFAEAQTEMDSSVAGMMNSLVPILALILGLLFFKLKTNRWQIMGISLGFVGAMVLMYDPTANFLFNRPTWLILLASLCYATNLNFVSRYLIGLRAMTISAGAFLWIGPMSLIYLATTDIMTVTAQHEQAGMAFLSILALAVLGTSLAVVLFMKLLQIAGTLVSSMVTYIIPVFALMWGVLDGERPEWFRIFGVLIILSGVYLVNKNKGATKDAKTKQ